MVLDKQGTGTKGNLIQFIPEGEQTPAPQNTFAKIYTHQSLDVSGTFTVLSVTDDFRYELKFEGGKIKTVAERRSRKSSVTGRTTGCTDWYLQTWAVWEDGTMTLISETYAGTTCDGDCWQARMINGRSFRAECSGSNGGNDIEHIYEEESIKIAKVDWWVENLPDQFGGGIVELNCRFEGRFYKLHPEKNKFTGNAVSDRLQILLNSWGGTDVVASSNTKATFTFPNNTQADGIATGTLIFPNDTRYNYSGTKTWTFSGLTWQ